MAHATLLANAIKIPIISLAQQRDKIVADMRHACRSVGFMYLQHYQHLVPDVLRTNLFHAMQQFFALPIETKRKSLQNKHNRGYTPWREELLDPTSQTVGDTKEGYYIGSDKCDPHLASIASQPQHQPQAQDQQLQDQQLQGANVWPDEHDAPQWRQHVTAYYNAMLALAMELLQLVGEALHLPHGHITRAGVVDDPIAILRLLHYSCDQSNEHDGVFACGAHSDYGLLTLLATDLNPGLQIFLRQRHIQQLQLQRSEDSSDTRSIDSVADDHDDGVDGGGVWIDVPPIENTLIINLGDCLERWTNGMFVSTRHRVITPPGASERYSAPFFFEPNFDCVIECLEQCCSPDNPARYAPIKFGDYLVGKYQATHSGYAT
jgi:isopenicillin N synthase-like dioxygenase